jgi:glyoxylase-like metal-dependent hydrolase (beta-lactamase superfamily II)
MSEAKHGLKVRQIEVGSMQNFVYLLSDEGTREAIAIDSGWETQPVTKIVSEQGYRVKYVIATHQHFDHTETINQLATKLSAKLLAHESSPLKCDARVGDGDSLRIGEETIRIIHTPGHTEDSICIYDGRDLFTGDTLFIDAWGRTDLPGGSAEKLYHSLHDKIMVLPHETVIYPGHDYGDVRSRTLREEAKSNLALLAKSADEFLAISA